MRISNSTTRTEPLLTPHLIGSSPSAATATSTILLSWRMERTLIQRLPLLQSMTAQKEGTTVQSPEISSTGLKRTEATTAVAAYLEPSTDYKRLRSRNRYRTAREKTTTMSTSTTKTCLPYRVPSKAPSKKPPMAPRPSSTRSTSAASLTKSIISKSFRKARITWPTRICLMLLTIKEALRPSPTQ